MEAAARIIEAAIARGVRDGAGALTLQGIASDSGVSKALVLYHYHDKDALLLAVVEELAARDVEALRRAAATPDALEGWRRVASEGSRVTERALLLALLQEAPLRPAASRVLAARAQAAAALGHAVLAAAGLRSRIASALLGRFVVQQLDGIAVGARERGAAALDAELDATALAMLGLGA